MSQFTDSVGDLIVRHFVDDAMRELVDRHACDVKDWNATARILGQLVRTSIAHANKQVNGRQAGTMTFQEAMDLARTSDEMVTRTAWRIERAVVPRADDDLHDMYLDNTEGGWSGSGTPYKPTDEDRAATDWMLYQTPEENWVDLCF